MKKIFKKIVKNIYQKYCFIFGMQRELYGVGIFTPPLYARSYLKRTFSQQGEDLTFERIWSRALNKKLNHTGVYVDLGAFHPIEHSVTYNLYLRNWRGLALDASEETKKLYEKYRPRDIFINSVVGKEDKDEVSFFFHKSGDLSLINSKYPENKNDFVEKKLKQVNVNTVLEKHKISEIDFLNIDIEGAEIEILETLDFDKHKPKVIAVEIHGNDVLKAIENPISKLLFDHGYTLVGVNVITYFFVKY